MHSDRIGWRKVIDVGKGVANFALAELDRELSVTLVKSLDLTGVAVEQFENVVVTDLDDPVADPESLGAALDLLAIWIE